MNLEASESLLARAREVIPSMTQTFSKGPNQWAQGVSPSFLDRGDGAWVWDVDGNKYLDHLMALGPIILGYNNPRINQVVSEQLQKGAVFSQMNALEVEVAELLVEHIPCAEMVRFGKNGSDATTAAVRAARASTGRDIIACCGYHGWHDWYIGTTTRNLGVPQSVTALTKTFQYNDIGSLHRVFDSNQGNVAAVIMEPVGVVPPDPGFLEDVQQVAHAYGALLIFDEVVTGFRFALGGAQDYFGITPDLACFGKAMANGLPLSAVVGRRDIMQVFDDAFFSGTFGGETLALASCKATIAEMTEHGVIDHIDKVGSALIDGSRALVEQYGLKKVIQLVGYPPRSLMVFPHEDERETRLRRTFFLQECVKRGLLYYGVHVPTASHRDREVQFTLDVFSEVMPLFAAAYQAGDFADRLEGECVEPIFRKA